MNFILIVIKAAGTDEQAKDNAIEIQFCTMDVTPGLLETDFSKGEVFDNDGYDAEVSNEEIEDCS